MGWFRGLSGNEVCGHYHPTECNSGACMVCFEDAIALGVSELGVFGGLWGPMAGFLAPKGR